MTEAEWLSATDPTPMLEFKKWTMSDRKLRLLICSWGYDIWPKMLDDASQQAIVVADRFADGLADELELQTAYQHALEAWNSIEIVRGGRHGKPIRSGETFRAAKLAAEVARNASDPRLGKLRVSSYVHRHHNGAILYKIACDLRDLFGPLPFRPVTINPAWLTSTAVAIATGVYEDRAFDRLPILADALQDAGCEDADILGHLRSDGPHARGCWVVDLVLGKG